MEKKAVFTFGRFQSPTFGHKKVVDKVVELAKATGAEHRIYTSKVQDSKKNPIPYDAKIKHLKKLFPDANVTDDPDALTAFHVINRLTHAGFNHLTMVTGDDRTNEFKDKISKYIKKKDDPEYDPKKHFALDSFNVVSAGARDPSKETVEGISGTKMRDFVRVGDFASFQKYTPTKNVATARAIFNDVKRNLKEDLLEGIDHKSFGPMLDSFVSFASEKLGLPSVPKITYVKGEGNSFGHYNPSTNTIGVVTLNRHPMDICRTVAHELVHHKQNTEGRIKDVAQEGSTGSDIENEANAEAAKVMRWYAQSNPKSFSLSYVTEEGGAGEWGTSELTNRYMAETPGQGTPIQKMIRSKLQKEEVPLRSVLPQNGDGVGPEYGVVSSPTTVRIGSASVSEMAGVADMGTVGGGNKKEPLQTYVEAIVRRKSRKNK